MDVITWLITILLLIIAPWATRKAERDQKSFEFFCRHKEDLETFHFPNHNMGKEPLTITDEWALTVGNAIGETPDMTRLLVQDLWENGWSVVKIQNRLVEKAATNGKRIFFVTESEPHERS